MIGTRIIELKETTSTNVYASELLKSEDIAEGTVITAISQKSGKGLGSNTWESEKGKNLTISIVLRPEFLPVEKQFMLNKAISLGVYDMVSKLSGKPADTSIKWPNDIYIGDKKVSGILIETGIMAGIFKHAIVGIGININQKKFHSDAPNPVSLRHITGKSLDIHKCLTLLCSCIENRYSQLKEGKIEQLDNDYLAVLYRINKTALFMLQNTMMSGTIKGVNDYGKLLIEDCNGLMRECDLKEIKFLI